MANGSRRGQRSGSRRPYRRGYSSRRKVCVFCADKEKRADWKDINELNRFVSDSGHIRSRRKTGTCAKHQRRVAEAVKRARHMALLPYTMEHMRIMGKS